MASGVSSADVRSILSLPGPSTAQPTTSASSAAAAATAAALGGKGGPPARKGTGGIPRELYALIGPAAPSLSAQLAKPRLKQKPNLSGGGKAVKWEWQSFENNARKDGLKLGHWTKASADSTAEYPFAKYNVQSQVYTYTDEEYTRFLEDNEWTKEETDYLFNLAREFDLRFYVMSDRYEYPGGPPRSIEDIKDRYFSICRRLVRNRPWTGDENAKAQLIATFTYDKDRELTRKKYIMSLENRTPEQIAEEESLYVEIKRLELNESKFARERDELLRTLAGVDSGLPGIGSQDEENFAAIFSEAKGMKKKKGGMDIDSPISAAPSMISLGAPHSPTATRPRRDPAFDARHYIQVHDGAAPATKAAHQAAYLRTSKIPAPKTAVYKLVPVALAELGIQSERLVMPTRENCALLEPLLEAATALVETKRLVDKLEQDIRIMRAKIAEKEKGGSGNGEAMEVDGAEAGGGSVKEGAGKEVAVEAEAAAEVEDDADADADDDPDADADGEEDADGEVEEAEEAERGVSVAPSARSMRSTRSSGRKRTKRSASTSSAGTVTTTATRASRKRQKNV